MRLFNFSSKENSKEVATGLSKENPSEKDLKFMRDLTNELKLLKYREFTDPTSFDQEDYNNKLAQLEKIEKRFPEHIDPESPTKLKGNRVQSSNEIPQSKEKEGMFSSFFASGPKRGRPISHRKVSSLPIVETEFQKWLEEELESNETDYLMSILFGRNWKKITVKYIPEILKIRTDDKVFIGEKTLFDKIGIKSVLSFAKDLSIHQKQFMDQFGFLPVDKATRKYLDGEDLKLFQEAHPNTQKAINELKNIAMKISYCFELQKREQYNSDHFENKRMEKPEEVYSLLKEVRSMFNEVRNNKQAEEQRLRNEANDAMPSKTLKETYTEEEIQEIKESNRNKKPVGPKVLSEEEKNSIISNMKKIEDTLDRYARFFSKNNKFEEQKMIWTMCESSILQAINQR